MFSKLTPYFCRVVLETRKQRSHIFHQALQRAAGATLKKAPLKLERVAAVLDCSYSSFGSSEKRRRPLGVAVATHYLLQSASKAYRAFWTVPVQDALQITARGQTDLATPLLAALSSGAELIVIVSDGCENDPPNGAAEVLRDAEDLPTMLNFARFAEGSASLLELEDYLGQRVQQMLVGRRGGVLNIES